MAMPANQVRTGVVRLSYVHLNEPRPSKDGKPGKYEASILIPKSDTKTVAAINAIIEAQKEIGAKTKWPGKKINPTTFKEPLHDGDVEKEGDPAYAGMWFLSAKNKNQVICLDRNLVNITGDESKIYSGVYAKVVLSFFPFNNESIGIGCGLEAVQIIRAGEPLGNTITPEVAAGYFDELPGDESTDEDDDGFM